MKAVVGGVFSTVAGLVATLVRVDGLTPKALTVKNDDAMMKSDDSFMIDLIGVLLRIRENVALLSQLCCIGLDDKISWA